MGYQVNLTTESSVPAVLVRLGAAGQKAVKKTLGFKLPALGTTASDGAVTALARTGDEWLLCVADAQAEGEVFARIDETLDGQHGAVARVGAANSRLTLEGEGLADVFAQISPMDFHGPDCAPGRTWVGAFGRASAQYHRREDGALDIYCESTQVRYAKRLVQACAGS